MNRCRSSTPPIRLSPGAPVGLRGEPISALRPAPGKTAKEELPRVPALGDDDEVLVSARGVEVKEQAYVVLVAAPLEVQTDTLSTVGLLLLAASPLLIALVGWRYGYWSASPSRPWNVSVGRWQRSTVSGCSGRVEVPPTGDEIAALAFDDERMLDKLEHSDTRASGVLLRREPRAAQPLVDAGDDCRGREPGRDRQDLARHAADRAQ